MIGRRVWEKVWCSCCNGSKRKKNIKRAEERLWRQELGYEEGQVQEL